MSALASRAPGRGYGNPADAVAAFRSTVADRLDAAATAIGLEPDELAALPRILLPEEFGERAVGTERAAATPGTLAKVSAMARRAALGQSVFRPGDADGDPDPAGDGRAAPEYVLVIRLHAPDRAGAEAEAAARFGGTLPAGAELQAV
jgi:hypothetical protein